MPLDKKAFREKIQSGFKATSPNKLDLSPHHRRRITKPKEVTSDLDPITPQDIVPESLKYLHMQFPDFGLEPDKYLESFGYVSQWPGDVLRRIADTVGYRGQDVAFRDLEKVLIRPTRKQLRGRHNVGGLRELLDSIASGQSDRSFLLSLYGELADKTEEKASPPSEWDSDELQEFAEKYKIDPSAKPSYGSSYKNMLTAIVKQYFANNPGASEKYKKRFLYRINQRLKDRGSKLRRRGEATRNEEIKDIMFIDVCVDELIKYDPEKDLVKSLDEPPAQELIYDIANNYGKDDESQKEIRAALEQNNKQRLGMLWDSIAGANNITWLDTFYRSLHSIEEKMEETESKSMKYSMEAGTGFANPHVARRVLEMKLDRLKEQARQAKDEERKETLRRSMVRLREKISDLDAVVIPQRTANEVTGILRTIGDVPRENREEISKTKEWLESTIERLGPIQEWSPGVVIEKAEKLSKAFPEIENEIQKARGVRGPDWKTLVNVDELSPDEVLNRLDLGDPDIKEATDALEIKSDSLADNARDVLKHAYATKMDEYLDSLDRHMLSRFRYVNQCIKIHGVGDTDFVIEAGAPERETGLTRVDREVLRATMPLWSGICGKSVVDKATSLDIDEATNEELLSTIGWLADQSNGEIIEIYKLFLSYKEEAEKVIAQLKSSGRGVSPTNETAKTIADHIAKSKGGQPKYDAQIGAMVLGMLKREFE